MMRAGVRMGKTFAVVGLVYSSSECTIEKVYIHFLDFINIL